MSRKRLLVIILIFIAFGVTSEVLLWRIPKNDIPLAILAPVLTFTYALERWLPFIKNLSAVQNEFGFILPSAVVYFGLVGFWVGKIWREEGFFKLITFLCLAGFIAIIHWQAFTFLKSLITGI